MIDLTVYPRPARNLRLLAEYTRDIECKDNRIVLGVISAFYLGGVPGGFFTSHAL